MDILKRVRMHLNLKNKELNQFYLSIILISFGIALISIFIPIYLYKIGYTIYSIILFYALISFFFLIFSQLCTKIISKIGSKHSMLLSTPFVILFFLSLNFITKYPILFYVAPLFDALHRIFYWYGHHTFFFLNSDKGKRGKEISITHILSLLTLTIAPFIGGLLATKSITLLIFTGSFFIIISSLPLLLTKENYTPKNFTLKNIILDIKSKQEKKDLISFAGYAIESIIEITIWPIYLIIILVTYTKTGLIVSLTTAISLMGLYIAGKISKRKKRKKIIKIFTLIHFIAWILRIFASTQLRLIFIETYKKFTNKLVIIPWTAQVYQLEEKRDFFRFIVFEHMTFHLTRFIILPILALIFYINFYPFIITFILAGIASLGYMFINKK